MDLARIYYAGRVAIGSAPTPAAPAPRRPRRSTSSALPEEVVEKIHMFKRGLHHRRDHVRVQLDLLRPPRSGNGHAEVFERGRDSAL